MALPIFPGSSIREHHIGAPLPTLPVFPCSSMHRMTHGEAVRFTGWQPRQPARLARLTLESQCKTRPSTLWPIPGTRGDL